MSISQVRIKYVVESVWKTFFSLREVQESKPYQRLDLYVEKYRRTEALFVK